MPSLPELRINGTDAAVWGVRMGDGFIDALTEPLTPKDPVENESRTEHGKRVAVDSGNVFFKSREVLLDFTVEGATPAEFEERKRMFLDAMYNVNVTVEVPRVNPCVYRLVYRGNGTDYAVNWQRTFCHFVLKFDEPNPMDRDAEQNG